MGDIVDLGKYRKKRKRSETGSVEKGRRGGEARREPPASSGSDSAEGRRGELIKIEPDPQDEA
jgi:hypothetical protein